MKPNIVYLHSHDTGRYIQPYGHAIPTPNLQHLAEQGVLFRQAFCAAPTCSPSRAALLTGQSPHNAGMLGLAHRGFSLKDYAQHIIHTLKANGYVSVLAGMQHVSRSPDRIGYDQILPVHHGKTEVDSVLPSVKHYLANKPQQPFFLSIGFTETHREFSSAGWREDPRYTLPPAPLPDTPETRQDMADYKASARILDRGVGMVLDLLDTYHLADDTLVICTTDHGIAFPAMKCNLTDHGTGVMLIMRGPGGFVGGKVCDALVSHIDIFPTVCEILDIAPPAWLQGKSMLPLVQGTQEEIHDEIFAEVSFHAAYEPMRSVRTRRYKYIRRFDDFLTPVLPNCDESPSKTLLLENGWSERINPREYLFDLIFDPNEAHNCINDASYAAIAADMRNRLTTWMELTDDILLRESPIKTSSEVVINLQSQVSPDQPVYKACGLSVY